MNFIGYCVKTEVGTFRLNKKTLESLKKEADSESLSLNALVNKILETHINWHSSAAKLGIIPISSEVVGHLFKNMSDDDIKKLAKKQAPLITEDLLLFSRYSRIAFHQFGENTTQSLNPQRQWRHVQQ